MVKRISLIDKFDQLDSIDPSAGWEEKLLLKINNPQTKNADYSGTRLLFFAILILFIFNLFSVSKNWMNERSRQNITNLKNIASEYLITTNSSKF
jgi:hypothetical protein